MTDLACAVLAPIQLASLGQLAEMCRLINHTSREWHFPNDDREAAYKQPHFAGKQRDGGYLPSTPTDGRWFGFMGRTLMFGAISDVLRYNISPRILHPSCSGLPYFRHTNDRLYR